MERWGEEATDYKVTSTLLHSQHRLKNELPANLELFLVGLFFTVVWAQQF